MTSQQHLVLPANNNKDNNVHLINLTTGICLFFVLLTANLIASDTQLLITKYKHDPSKHKVHEGHVKHGALGINEAPQLDGKNRYSCRAIFETMTDSDVGDMSRFS